jgi:trimeric autotransporter adhesin
MKLFRLKEKNYTKQKFNGRAVLFVSLMLVCFAPSPIVQAVNPPPDGGYPGSNTAEGQSALLSLTSGTLNTAVGASSLRSVTAGTGNTGVGGAALYFNTANENTATGAGALYLNNNGSANTANGAFALFANTTGAGNTAIGDRALLSNTTGLHNTATGSEALHNNRESSRNTAIGWEALFAHETGDRNTAIGFGALAGGITGTRNTATGHSALGFNSSDSNTANGYGALSLNTSGSFNTALGVAAGGGVTTASNVICIGANVDGENVSNSCYIGQIFGATSSRGAAVFINSDGKLGTTTSSRRFKEEIKPMAESSETLFALKPVTFRYKKEIDPQGMPQFGLVAEDVEAVNPDLVMRDKEGRSHSVRYDQLNAMLLNEFLKEHRNVEEQKATIAQLKSTVERQEATSAQQQKQIEALTSGLAKVNTQLEASKPRLQVVDNNY